MSKKTKLGRPSKFEPKFCDQLIAHMAGGLSFESFAGKIGVHRDTLYAWEKEHSAFSDAKKVGTEKSRLFWEELGIDHIINTSDSDGETKTSSSRSLNSTVWIFNMKNRFGWRDRQPDEADKVVVNNFATLTDEQLDAEIARREKVLKGGK